MRVHRTTLPTLLLALAAACSGADAPTATASAAGPSLDAIPPAWIGGCAALVRFNVPPLGTVFGAPVGQPPGTGVFVEGGIGVRTAQFMAGGVAAYNYARIEPAPATPFGDGQVARMNNMNFRYIPIPPGGPYYSAIFEFRDLGGVENFSINGAPLYVGDISLLPSPYFAWSTGVSTAPVPGGVEGTVRLTGTTALTEIMVGGQEFWIDNVCFR